MNSAVFVALMLASLVTLFLTAHAPDYRFFVRSAMAWSVLAVCAWYIRGLPTANHAALLGLLTGTAARAAWRAHRARPRPGWWNGEHERIEQA